MRFATDCPATTPDARLEPVIKKDFVAATPRRRLQGLEVRFYTPLGFLRHGEQNRRLWRMKRGLSELMYFGRQYREATLQEAGSMGAYLSSPSTENEVAVGVDTSQDTQTGEDPSYPTGKAEWICHYII